MRDHRLAHGLDRLRQRVDQPPAADPHLVVVGAELARDQVGELELVAGALADVLEADRERRQPGLALAGEQRDDQRGVQAAAEQDPDRHVGHHPAPDGALERLAHRVRPVVDVEPALERRVPVDALDASPVGLDREDRRRRELGDAAQDRARRGHDRVPRQVVVQRDRVHARVDAAARQQRRQRRGRAQRAAGLAPGTAASRRAGRGRGSCGPSPRGARTRTCP